MTGPESRLVAKIKDLIRGRGGYAFKVHGSVYVAAGTPDLLVCYRGLFLGLEVKTPSTQGNVSEKQEFELKKIQRAGGITAVVWSTAQVITILDGIDRKLDRPLDM